MSKIQAELCKAGEVEPKKGEARRDFIVRLVETIQDVPDKVWDKLSGEAQDWYNSAADAIKAKARDIPEMPDYEEPKAEAPARSSRGSTKAAPKDEPETITKVDDIATVVTKRGTFTGKVLEVDDEIIVIDVDGEEKEFLRERVDSITVNHGDANDEGGSEDEGDDLVKVGNEVVLTNSRDKEFTGKIVELDGDLIVLEVDGKDVEFVKDRVKSIKAAGAAEKPARSSRSSAKAEDPAPARSSRSSAKDAPKEEDKPKRASNPAGVSVGGRIRELMCEDMAITEEEVGKVLKEEGIQFRDTSLSMIFRETSFVFAQLKANKKLK